MSRHSPPERTPQIVGVQTGLPQDPRERPLLQFLMDWNNEGRSGTDLLQSNVAAALSHDLPAVGFEHLDQAPTGDHR
jgi:hypothetical protein